jgi:cupin fold WbuC family metalloprotein
MFVIYSKSTYVRPNRHRGKDESLTVLSGSADVVFFDDFGGITEVVPVSDSKSDKAYFCRIPRDVWHTVVIRSENILLFEATPGPFDPTDTSYASWAPSEQDVIEVRDYLNTLDIGIALTTARAETQTPLRDYDQINPKVYASKTRIVPFASLDGIFLLGELRNKNLDRVRICAHTDSSDKLQEMLMSFSDHTYIRPSLHLNKEESILFLDGFGTYFFFDELGNVTSQVQLGPQNSGRQFYCRVPANTYHALVLESSTITVKETTSGPFRRSDTVFAEWSPDESNPQDVSRYLATLRSQIR